jgi:hypothetical protein
MKNHHSIYQLIIQIALKHHAHVTAIQRCSQIKNIDNKNKNKVDFESTGFVSISLSVGGNSYRLICSRHPINRFIHS